MAGSARSEIRVRRHRRPLPAVLSVRAHVTFTVISGTDAASCWEGGLGREGGGDRESLCENLSGSDGAAQQEQ